MGPSPDTVRRARGRRCRMTSTMPPVVEGCSERRCANFGVVPATFGRDMSILVREGPKKNREFQRRSRTLAANYYTFVQSPFNIVPRRYGEG